MSHDDVDCNGSHGAPACGFDCPKYCGARGGGGADCGCSSCVPAAPECPDFETALRNGRRALGSVDCPACGGSRSFLRTLCGNCERAADRADCAIRAERLRASGR